MWLPFHWSPGGPQKQGPWRIVQLALKYLFKKECPTKTKLVKKVVSIDRSAFKGTVSGDGSGYKSGII